MVERDGPGSLSPQGERELEALLHLRLLPRVGDLAATRLLARFGSARAAVEAPDRALREIAGPAAVRLRSREGRRKRDEARGAIQRARDLGMTVVGRGLPGYPGRLEHLADPPPVLFMMGRWELLAREGVAVVGTRRATGAGRRFASGLGRTLSDHGIPVVSGLALGIDGAAHRGALEGLGSTVAVLGTGLDQVHPRSHTRLQATIAERGLLVGEFPPGEPAAPHHFPRRNRILAGLARALVVVEAGARSGAFITVDHALDLGADVFAVPGSIEQEQSRGTNSLLRDGAHVLTRPEHFLRWWEERATHDDSAVARRPSVDPDLRAPDLIPGSDPEAVLSALGSRPLAPDELSQRLRFQPARVLRALSELELLGVVVLEDDGWRAASPRDDPDPTPRDFSRVRGEANPR